MTYLTCARCLILFSTIATSIVYIPPEAPFALHRFVPHLHNREKACRSLCPNLHPFVIDRAMTHEETKPTHHYGRGGAGNVTAKPDKPPADAPSVTPTLKSKNYTTGRGGQGNIVENKDPETARLAQDVDVPGIVLPEGGAVHTGRGGGGNVVKLSEEEQAANRENNNHVRTASHGRSEGLKDKVKHIFSSSDKETK